jgi:hypothetical protein
MQNEQSVTKWKLPLIQTSPLAIPNQASPAREASRQICPVLDGYFFCIVAIILVHSLPTPAHFSWV